MDDDARLIEATLTGKSAAFGQLVLKHQDRLFNSLMHMTANREDARDLVQEAFVQALANGVRFGWITADELYANYPVFVDGLEKAAKELQRARGKKARARRSHTKTRLRRLQTLNIIPEELRCCIPP